MSCSPSQSASKLAPLLLHLIALVEGEMRAGPLEEDERDGARRGRRGRGDGRSEGRDREARRGETRKDERRPGRCELSRGLDCLDCLVWENLQVVNRLPPLLSSSYSLAWARAPSFTRCDRRCWHRDQHHLRRNKLHRISTPPLASLRQRLLP
eukprot:764916-Hanusia_phi.AAC.1